MAESYKKPQSPIKLKNLTSGDTEYIYPLTTSDQVMNESGGRISTDIDTLYAVVNGKQEQHIATECTLYASQWEEGCQTINISDVTPTNTVIVTSHPSNSSSYMRNNVLCVNQNDGSLVFECDTTPDRDLLVNIIILN